MVEPRIGPISPSSPRFAPIRVDQYHRMLESGILQDGDPIELLDGLLVYKDRSARGGDPMTIGQGHNLVIKLLARLDPALAPYGCHMQTQGPVSMPPHQEPEPDGAIVRGQPRDYSARLPGASDVTCVIEAAESSLEHDRTTKLSIYARAGIPMYVIINLVERRVEVVERPVPTEGRYANASIKTADEAVALLVPGERYVQVPVKDLLP